MKETKKKKKNKKKKNYLKDFPVWDGHFIGSKIPLYS